MTVGTSSNATPATILVVDDNQAVRYLTRRILEREGYRVTEAADGHQALRMARDLPNLVVLDIKLPDISGFEVCATLRRDPITAHLPVLHLSSTFLDEASVIEGLEGGADGYLTLPVETPVLLAYVRALLRAGRMVRGLQDSERRFRTMFEGMTDGLLLADPRDRVFRMANKAICDMLGYDERELQDMWITDIHPESVLERLASGFSEVLDGNAPLVPNLPALRKDGTVISVDITNTLIGVAGRTMVLGSFRDVTERQAVQARLAQSDRLASVGMLAAGVAHELNNPLAFMLYNLEAIVEDLGRVAAGSQRADPDLLTDLLAKVGTCKQGAERMRGIVRDLQTFSRHDGSKDRPLQLRPLIEAVAAMAANEIRFRARLEMDFDETLPVHGNEGHLSQVFLNLLVNAAHAIEEGHPERNTIRISMRARNDEIHVTVSDTGCGIAPDAMDKLFDPFFTTKAPGEGTGLGLAICHRIVDEHGGRIEVSSQPDMGTSFEVILPTCSPPPGDARHQADTDSDPQPPCHARVLVVDDEPYLLRALRRLLVRAGYEVVATSSGLEAQHILEQDTNFDSIVCDLMMPDILGMDLHAWLAERSPDLAARVVFLTGGAFTPRAQDYLGTVENPVLSKPISTPDLLAALRDRRRQPT